MIFFSPPEKHRTKRQSSFVLAKSFDDINFLFFNKDVCDACVCVSVRVCGGGRGVYSYLIVFIVR